jgi:O-antigen ligase
MEQALDKTSSSPLVYAESVVIGDRSSRLSATVVFLLWFVPVFATVLFGGVDTITWVVISIIWLGIVVLWLGDAWRGEGLLFNTDPLQLPLLGLLLIGVIQLLPIGAISSMDPFATRFFVLHLVIYAVFFAGCLTYLNTQSRVRKTVVLVVVFGSLMAFVGILQKLANPTSIYGLRGSPMAVPFGPFVNQHHFAAFMEMTSGMALGLLFGMRTKKDKRILLIFSIILMGAAIVFTSSRGGVLGLLAAVAFVLIFSFFGGRRSRKTDDAAPNSRAVQKVAMAAGAAALLLLIFGLVLILGGNEALFRGIGVSEIQDGVSNGRAHFWPIAIKIFLERPLLGAGMEAFGVAFTKFDSWNGMFRVEQAHNDYLQTLADAGIAGFVCVVAFIYMLFRKGFRTVSASDGFRRDAAIGALAGCFGLLIHSFFDFPLRTPSNAFFFLLLCALAVVQVRSASRKRAHRRRRSTAH